MVLALVMPASAQITTGTPRTDNILTGNRLEAGTWGVFFGVAGNFGSISGRNLDGIGDYKPSFQLTPLVNVKYMLDDQIETRLGIEICKEKDFESNKLSEDNGGDEYTGKEVSSCMYLRPGAAYHWSNKNILDVYAGAELPFGFSRYVEFDDNNGTEYKYVENEFTIGLGAFIGLQAFIGNLPVAVGCEYGISTALYNNQGIGKVTDGDQTYKVYDYSSTQYESLKARNSGIYNKISFSLSYYFK